MRSSAHWFGSLSFLLTLVGTARPVADEPPAVQHRSIPVAIVQFDAVPEAVSANLDKMERLARQAAKQGARWVVFHEGAVCDYTDKLDQLAEAVPGGPSTRRMERLAKDLRCVLCFGLSEKDGDRVYITQVFVGPEGFVYRYRKTWLHKDPADRGFRNEYAVGDSWVHKAGQAGKPAPNSAQPPVAQVPREQTSSWRGRWA